MELELVKGLGGMVLRYDYEEDGKTMKKMGMTRSDVVGSARESLQLVDLALAGR